MGISNKSVIYQIPDPPALPGVAGAKFYDPLFGTQIMQVTANSAGARHYCNEGQWGQFGTPQTSGGNVGKQYFFIRDDTSPRNWEVYLLDPVAFSVSFVRNISQTGYIWGTGAQFDQTGKRPGVVYALQNSYTTASRKIEEYDCESNVMSTAYDFSADIQMLGTITGVTSSSDFSGNAASPLSLAQLSPHFFTKQRLRFTSTTTTSSLRDVARVIRSFDDSTGRYRFDGYTVTNATNASPIVVTCSERCSVQTGDTVTISGVSGNTSANGSFTATYVGPTQFSLQGSTGNGAYTSGGTFAVTFPSTPTIGDTYVVEPAGYNHTIQPGGEYSGGARYIWVSIAEEAERSQDYAHILGCFDRQLSTFSVKYFTSSEMGLGIHQVVAAKSGKKCLLTNQGSSHRLVWNGDTQVGYDSSTDTFHRAASKDVWYQIGNVVGTITKRPFNTDASVDVETTVYSYDVGSGSPWQNDGHISCNACYTNPHIFSIASTLTVQTVPVVHSAPVYKYVGWVANRTGGQGLPLIESNSPVGVHNGKRLVHMGSASSDASAAALITGSGQYSYATATNTVFVRGYGDADLTLSTQHWVYFSEGRPLLEEIAVINATNGAVWRVCHTHARMQGSAAGGVAGDTLLEPKGVMDPTGKYIMFNSVWNRNDGTLDVFIAKIDNRTSRSQKSSTALRGVSNRPVSSHRPRISP